MSIWKSGCVNKNIYVCLYRSTAQTGHWVSLDIRMVISGLGLGNLSNHTLNTKWHLNCQFKIWIKRPNRLLKVRKSQLLFEVLLFLCQKKHLNYKNITRNFLRNWDYVLLGSLFLMFPWRFEVSKIAHCGYNGATVCILLHRQLSAPIRKSSSIHIIFRFWLFFHRCVVFSQ